MRNGSSGRRWGGLGPELSWMLLLRSNPSKELPTSIRPVPTLSPLLGFGRVRIHFLPNVLEADVVESHSIKSCVRRRYLAIRLSARRLHSSGGQAFPLAPIPAAKIVCVGKLELAGANRQRYPFRDPVVSYELHPYGRPVREGAKQKHVLLMHARGVERLRLRDCGTPGVSPD